MNVLHVSSAHSVADVRILHKQCMSLSRAGYKVSLLGVARTNSAHHGIEIVGLPERQNRFYRMSISQIHIFRLARNRRTDIIHFHDPELIPFGIMMRLLGKIVIYDVHEDVPRQILQKTWIASWLRRTVSACTAFTEWLSSRFIFSGIVAATPTIAARFPKSKTVTVSNFPIRGELGSRNGPNHLDRNGNCVYVGGLAVDRGIIQMIEAINLVDVQDCRLVLAGRFENTELEYACRMLPGWSRVDFKGWLDRDGIAEEFAMASVGLVLFHPAPNHDYSLPTKMFEYMSAGIPVIASAIPFWSDIIQEANCGLVLDPKDPEAIANAITNLLRDPVGAERLGKNGFDAVNNRYNWSIEERKLLSFYQSRTNLYR